LLLSRLDVLFLSRPATRPIIGLMYQAPLSVVT